MNLHGSIIKNLENAVASASRLRGHPVYKDTVVYWAELLQAARRARHGLSSQQIIVLEAAIAKLEIELADRAK